MRRAIYQITRSPSQTCHAKPKLKSGAGRYQLLSRWWDAYRKQFGLEYSLRKVRTLWHCSRLRSVALYLWLIVVDIRQAIDRCSNIWVTLALVMVSSVGCQLTAWLQKFKEAGGTVREIDVWADTAIISALVICIIVCPSWAVNHYRDNAITYKAQRDKNARELKLANAAITDMQMRQRDVAAPDAKYTKEYWASGKWCSAWWCCRAGRRRLHISSLSVSAWSHHASAIMQPPPDWQTPLNGIISPSERGWSLCKNNWKEPRSILMSSADRVAHIDGQLAHLLWAHNTALMAANASVIKPSNPFTNVCLASKF